MDLTGRIYDSTGAAKVGLTVTIKKISDNSSAGSDTTDSNGEWSVTSLGDDDSYYIEVVSGTDKYVTWGNVDVGVRNLRAELIHYPVATELTLSSAGAIAVTQNVHYIDSYGDAASDEVVTITGGYENQVVTFFPANGARDIVFPANTSPIPNGVYNNTAFTLDNANDECSLRYRAALGYWTFVSKMNNGS